MINLVILLVGDLLYDTNMSVLSAIFGSVVAILVGKVIEFFRFCVASILAVMAFVVGTQILFTEQRIPFAVYLMSAMFAPAFTLVARLTYRMYRNTKIKSAGQKRRRVMLVGAGDAAGMGGMGGMM